MHTHAPSWMVVSSEVAADISYQALIPAIIFTLLALAAVALRLYSRACLTRSVGLEDYLVTTAMILSTAITGIVGREFHLDTNSRNNEILAPLVEKMMKLVYAQSMFYHLAIMFVKLSIIIQYKNIFIRISQRITFACFTLLIATIVAGAWGFAGVAFLCNPVRKYWRVEVPGTCIDPERHFWSTAIVGIILDFAIWLLPMPVVGKLQLPFKQRVGLLVPFGLGAFVCTVSILRLVLVHDAAEQGNVTKSGTHAVIWSTVEVNVAIICASLLVMKPLFVRFMSGMFDSPPTARDDERAFRRCITISTLNDPRFNPFLECGSARRLGSEIYPSGGSAWKDSRIELEREERAWIAGAGAMGVQRPRAALGNGRVGMKVMTGVGR